jgi:hypothetical protein
MFVKLKVDHESENVESPVILENRWMTVPAESTFGLLGKIYRFYKKFLKNFKQEFFYIKAIIFYFELLEFLGLLFKSW